ncbi:MAG: CoA transferase [Pseudomonadales bacterium]
MALRILEVGGLAAGFCGRLYRHAGADVVRVEQTAVDAWVSDEALDIFLHHGKRRVASADARLIQELAASADVLVMEGTLETLTELGWYALDGPVVRVAITPFGLTGPMKDWRATSSILLAMGGYTYIMGDPERAPLTLPGHYVQYQAGQHAYIAANALGFEGEANQTADVSMWETLLSLSQFTTVLWTSSQQVRQRHGSDFGLLYPINQFPCRDGWFHVNVVPAFWGPFTRMLERPELELDPRFLDNAKRRENIDALDAIIVAQLGDKTRAEIMRLGEEARVPTGILQELPEVLADKHLAEREFFLDVDGTRVPDIAFRYTAT